MPCLLRLRVFQTMSVTGGAFILALVPLPPSHYLDKIHEENKRRYQALEGEEATMSASPASPSPDHGLPGSLALPSPLVAGACPPPLGQ